jgi:hypothetical protein
VHRDALLQRQPDTSLSQVPKGQRHRDPTGELAGRSLHESVLWLLLWLLLWLPQLLLL